MGKSIIMMNTPNCCAECILSDDCAERCTAIDKLLIDVDGESEKPNWCPLVDVDKILIRNS